jgi:hypothetical protein
LRAEAVLTAVLCKVRHIFRYPRVLPDDGIGNRFPGFPLPEDGRFPLICDADGGEVGGAQAALGERFCDDFFCAAQNFQWIMLDPSGLRKNLFMFFCASATMRRICQRP